MKTGIQTKNGTWMFKAALLITAKKQKWNNCPSTEKMDKQNMTCLHSGIVLSYKNEWSTDTQYNMDEPQKHYVTSKKPDTKKSHITWFLLLEISRTGKSAEIGG